MYVCMGWIRYYQTVTGRLCRWLGDRIGYRCDGPIERSIWSTYNRMRHGATDCDGLCRSQGNPNGGSCVHGNEDHSTWCPRGQHCQCARRLN